VTRRRLRQENEALRAAVAGLTAQLQAAHEARRHDHERHKAELDAMALRAARAEACAVNLAGMCKSRATCLANTSAAEQWRHMNETQP
jgi:hypothetical protein